MKAILITLAVLFTTSAVADEPTTLRGDVVIEGSLTVRNASGGMVRIVPDRKEFGAAIYLHAPDGSPKFWVYYDGSRKQTVLTFAGDDRHFHELSIAVTDDGESSLQIGGPSDADTRVVSFDELRAFTNKPKR